MLIVFQCFELPSHLQWWVIFRVNSFAFFSSNVPCWWLRTAVERFFPNKIGFRKKPVSQSPSLSVPCRPGRRGTTTCSTSCLLVWTTGTSRSSTCRELRPTITWTKYTKHYFPYNYFTSLVPDCHFCTVFLKGGSCELRGKQDKQDFQLLIRCFETIGLHADQISTIWAILSSILQLGNMCFSSYEVCGRKNNDRTDQTFITFLSFPLKSESFEVARIFSEAEARRVGSLLQISSEALQTVITHRVTVSSFCRTVRLPFTFLHADRQISTSVHRRRSTTGSTAPCLWKVPLNPGKKISWKSLDIDTSVNPSPKSAIWCNILSHFS